MKSSLAILSALLLGAGVSAEEPPFGMRMSRMRLTAVQAKQASRVEPQAFPGLPTAIGKDLKKRGCTIPQSYMRSEPHNVIQGQFYQPGQTDWAVLCSRNDQSVILVYSKGLTIHVDELAREQDQLNLETWSDGSTLFGFVRSIHPVGEHYIVDHYNSYGGPTPPPLDHQGINDAFVEKASTVHYWYLRQWIELTGAD